MASAAAVRRKLLAVKAKARAAGRRAKRRQARSDRIVPTASIPPVITEPRLDPTRSLVSLGGEQRLRRLEAPPTDSGSPSLLVRPSPVPRVPIQVITPIAERRFMRAQAHEGVRVGMAHCTWAFVAYIGCLALATQSALSLPPGASQFDEWRSFGLWLLFVVMAASVLVVTWGNMALPALMSVFGIFLLAWRGPFLAMGVFADAGDWTNDAVPWWSLLIITFITKALETRGRRRRYHLRTLMVLQGMQIATYAGLVLLSIFFLGTGAIRADWTLTIVTLLVAWFVQGRSLLVMWNRTVGTIKPASASPPAPVWNSAYEHTGK